MNVISRADQQRLLELTQEAKNIMQNYKSFDPAENTTTVSVMEKANLAIDAFGRYVSILNFNINQF